MLPAMDVSEATWIERARKGDRRAFDRLVDAHAAAVWRVAWRIVRHREDAEDVVQETFLAAFRSMPEFRGEAAFSTWLHQIARSRALNHLQRASERGRRASAPLDADREESVPDRREPSPLRALESKELLRRLAECFEKLPAPWKAVLALRDAESLSYEAIAEAVGIELGTVRSRLARARFALKDCVDGGTR